MEALVASATGKMLKALQSLKATVHYPVALHNYGKMGFGLKTTSPIPKATTIFEVPESISGKDLTHLDPLKEKLTSPILKFVDETVLLDKPYLQQRMRIAFQFSNILRDRTHPLFPYLDALPLDNLNFPIYWKSPSSTFSRHLRTEIVDGVSSTRGIYEKIYSTERKIISNVSFEEFMWTHTMADSRSFDLAGDIRFIPLIDLLNHSFQASNCVISRKDAGWTLVTSREVQAQEQLLLNYGPWDSYQYIIRWGFFEVGNPNQAFYTNIEQMPEWDRIVEIAKLRDKSPISELSNPEAISLMQFKKKLLLKHNLPLLFGSLPQAPPASNFEATFRIVFLQASELLALGFSDIVQAFEKLDVYKPISKENEQRVRAAIIKVANFHLSGISDDWKADLEPCAALEDEEKAILVRNRDFYLSQQRVKTV